MSLSFESDYTLGAHPNILEALVKTNLSHQPGYGEDEFTQRAKDLIRSAFGVPGADVFLLSGGTQTNRVLISSVLRNYQGVIAANSGHIAVHEAGAIESSGHKVITLPSHLGKLLASDLEDFMSAFDSDPTRDHTVFPGMVYVSQPTEYGTVYSLSELTGLYRVCREHGLFFYVDGARLGYALEGGFDGTGPDLAASCDGFYVGGTKVGCLCGEALVFPNGAPKHFFTSVKQNGALLAKGRLLGVQFETLFEDGLYFRISRNAVEKADLMRGLFSSMGFEFLLPTTSNQIFVIMEKSFAKALSSFVRFGFWEPFSETHAVYRFASCWATSDGDIEELKNALTRAGAE